MPPFKDLIGLKFGRLTVTKALGKLNGRYMYECNCDCGNLHKVSGINLTSNDVKSCGCLKEERGKDKRLRSFGNIYSSYKQHAREKSLEFNLTKEQFLELSQKDCTYCGIPPSNAYKDSRGDGDLFIYNGIDRIDSSMGYFPENCNPCCKRCNVTKNNMTLEDFKLHIQRIYDFYINK